MRTEEFDYHLPPELIAQEPADPRDSARLMVVDRATGDVGHLRFNDLPKLLDRGDLLVHNETRVIRARLFAQKPTGGKVEILLLRQRGDAEHAEARTWEALVGGRRVRPGMSLTLLDGPDGELTEARTQVVAEGSHAVRLLRFDRPVLPLAEKIGTTPLPPYIHEELKDEERYQTVYARKPGSAAAPTAGLHFTPDLLIELRDRGVRSEYVTLHVGLDTFQPVREEHVEEHRMHSEYCLLRYEVAREINQTKLRGERVVAVGTTSVRVLETAAQRAAENQPGSGACPRHTVAPFEGETELFIYPGYEFRAVDALVTNFHLPRSTLLLLVAAFAGRDLIQRAYAEAVDREYRFYSFGDAMLIL